MALETFSDIIKEWPSTQTLADDLGVSVHVVAKWRQRESIPSDQWVGVIGAADARGIENVTSDLLMALAARKPAAAAPLAKAS